MTEPELVTGTLPPPETSEEDFSVPAPGEKPKGKPRGRAAAKIKAEQLEDQLTERIREYVAVPIGMISPLGCAVLDERAERTSQALCRIAATSPAMRRALERFVTGSAMVDIAGTMVAVTIAIGVDLHRIEPGALPARMVGIPKHWQLVYPHESMWEHQPNGNGNVEYRGSFDME